MNERKIIVGLDLGSHRVSALVAEVEESGARRVLGLGTVPSEGIRKGVVVGFEPAVDSVRRAIEEAERACGLEIRSVYPCVTGDHFRAIRSEGVHATEGPGREIHEEDLEQVIRVARSLQLPSGYRILHTLPTDFILDSRKGIKDPVGMTGTRLQAEVLLLLGESSVLDNTEKVVERAGLSVEGMVFSPLATALAALQDAEREEGVIMMDIGAGTTEILVIREGAARHAEVLPLGSANITRDLSIGLNTSLEDAERLKLDHGMIHRDDATDEEMRVPIRQVGREEERFVTPKTLRSIIEPRVQELLEIAWERALSCSAARRPTSNVVLCGGGSLLPGLSDLASQLFERSVRLASPLQQQGLTAELQNPRYTPTVGLLQYGYRHLTQQRDGAGDKGRLGGNLKRWLRSVGRKGQK
ncbi:MAG: cell division protein FtsA [bacterium]|nr:cell division protein FtsA [bacterium]